jgi:ICP0-binding domain of Ubiquitin-specific protease 7
MLFRECASSYRPNPDPQDLETNSLIFLKWFDLERKELTFQRSTYVKNGDRVMTLAKDIMQMMGWTKARPQDIILFDEVQTGVLDRLSPTRTFQTQDIFNGDIICFINAEQGFTEYYHITCFADVSIQAPQLISFKRKRVPVALAEHYNSLLTLLPLKIEVVPNYGSRGKPFNLQFNQNAFFQDVLARVSDNLNVPSSRIWLRDSFGRQPRSDHRLLTYPIVGGPRSGFVRTGDAIMRFVYEVLDETNSVIVSVTTETRIYVHKQTGFKFHI